MTNPIAIKPMGFLVVLCVLFLQAASMARADLYTDGVLSVEWLVDSADEIHRVRLANSDKKRVEPLAVIKRRAGKPVAYDFNSEEWLLFVRIAEDGTAKVFRRINLTRPLAIYRTAAVTREGKPLADRKAVLAAVEARVKLKRNLPKRCDRDAIDKMIGTGGNASPPKIPRGMGRFGKPAPLDRHLGGVVIGCGCDYWDEGGPNDCDTILTRILVPVDPEDRPKLLEAAKLGDKYKGQPRYQDAVSALVNFPGKETESVLKEIIADRTRRRSKAREVLDYFLFCQEITDPLNKTLVGKWRLTARWEIIDFDLKRGGTFTAEGYDLQGRSAAKPKDKPTWQGKGRWLVRDGELTIYRDYILTGNRGKDWRRAVRYMPKQKPIIKATPDEIFFSDDLRMKRIKAAE